MSPELSAIEEESSLLTSVVKFETLVYFQPTDNDGNGVFRFEMIPRFTDSASIRGGMPKKKPTASAAASSTAPSEGCASGGFERGNFKAFDMPLGPIETFDAITKWIVVPGSGYLRDLQNVCETVKTTAQAAAGTQVEMPNPGDVRVKPSGIYVDYGVDTHVSIHFLDLGPKVVPQGWVAQPRDESGKILYLHTPTNMIQDVPPYIPTLSSKQLDTTQGKGEANAGASHFKFNLKTTGDEVCLGIQWELSMTVNPLANPFDLRNTDFKVSLSHKVVQKTQRGNVTQIKFATKMCDALAQFIVDVGERQSLFDNFALDSTLKSTLMRKAVADCIFKGQGGCKSNELNDPFNVLGLEQLMIANALRNKVTIAMVLEEDGTTVKYNPIACTEVSPGTLKHGECCPLIKGIRIRDGAYLEHAPILFDCAFDKRAVTATDSLETLLARDLYPVRRLLPAEEASFEQFYTRKPPPILQTIMQTIISEINEAAEREEAAAAAAAAATAAAAKAAAAAAAAAEEAEAAESDESVVFEAIFRFVRDRSRLPLKTEVSQVCAEITQSRRRDIDPRKVSTMIDKLIQKLDIILPQKKKDTETALTWHYSAYSQRYKWLYDEKAKFLKS
jgi:hypothetical protein